MVVGGGGIAVAPPRRQEDEQKERAGHARLRRLPHERRWCTRRANCSGAELLGVRWRTSGEDSPQRQVRKEKGLLRWGLKKGVGHPAAIAAAGRPGCSAPATLAPAAGRFPRTIPRKLAGKCLSVEAQKLRRTPLVPADNLEGLEDVAPIDLLAISRRRFLSRLPTPKSRVSWIVVSVRSARPSLWYCLMRERL